MRIFKGMIAIDIDGTLTQKKEEVDRKLIQYLSTVHKKNWQLVFVTGRNFSFSESIVRRFSSPLYVVVQNGAAIFSMPEKKLICLHSLNKKILHQLVHAAEQCKVALLIEFFSNGQDAILYDPEMMTNEEREYLQYRSTFFKGKWQTYHPLVDYPIEDFIVSKIFGKDPELKKFAEMIENVACESIFMRDPFRKDRHLYYIQSNFASKKNAILYLQQFFPDTQLMVAGDDLNDLSLLEIADHAIVMEHAPSSLKRIADCIIDTNPNCLIEALEKGMDRL